ncbi:hypothetical protein D3C83_94710 [compost metagenome]
MEESISSASLAVPMSPCWAIRLMLTPVTLFAVSALKSRIEPSAISVTSSVCEVMVSTCIVPAVSIR